MIGILAGNKKQALLCAKENKLDRIFWCHICTQEDLERAYLYDDTLILWLVGTFNWNLEAKHIIDRAAVLGILQIWK